MVHTIFFSHSLLSYLLQSIGFCNLYMYVQNRNYNIILRRSSLRIDDKHRSLMCVAN